MTYDTELVPVEMFNVPIKLPATVVAGIVHELSSSPEMHRYEIVRGFLTQATWWMHEPKMFEQFEKLATENATLWQTLHNKAYTLAKRALKELEG